MGKLAHIITECFLNWLDLHQFSQAMTSIAQLPNCKLPLQPVTEEYKVSKAMLIMTLKYFSEGDVKMRQDESGQPAKQVMKLKAGWGINNVWV